MWRPSSRNIPERDRMSTMMVESAPAPSPAEERPIRLMVKGVGKTFVGTTVLRDVDLSVREGEVVALLGENGAGKSTLSAIIAGLIRPDTGNMMWEGEPYAPASPGDAMAKGVGLIHQEMRLLPDLTIAENVFVGRLPMKAGRIDRDQMRRRASEQLKRLGLNISPDTPVRRLRVAAQQQVEIAKALTLQAKLLILDEPTAALGGDETQRLFAQIETLRAQGYSFIYISHRLEEIARIADRIVVLRDGQKVAEHETAQMPVQVLLQEMVGRSIERLFPHVAPPRPRDVITIDQLTAADGSFSDISFSVREGEIFGIAGIVGAGRTELVRAIAGADSLASGCITLDGKTVRLTSPTDAIAAGIVLVPEDRKAQGVLLEHTLGDNMALGNMDRIGRQGWIDPRKVRDFGNKLIERLVIKGQVTQQARYLSGGNQQKLVIARWVARAPKVFILDEPTRGIDVGARAAIYEVIAELAKSGMAVLVVSSDLEEVLGLSHRVMVLARGRQMGVLDRAEANNVAVMALATA
jgi:ribose transport system ATP-binding protein